MKNNMFTKLSRVLSLVALTAFSNVLEAQFNWGPAGPVYTAGRARNMVVDRNSPSTLYVGSASSGVFRSNDAGANWVPIDDQGTVKNISYMAQAINNVIYVGTGEGFLRYGQKTRAQIGSGLYQLNGSQLSLVASSAITGTCINRIACSPVDASKIAIATNKGILISSDGGSSFTTANLAAYTVTNDVTYGMDVKFDNTGVLYCSIGNERGNAPFTNVSGRVFRSSDNTLSTFSNITPTNSILGDSNYGRIELAVSPTNNNIVYASCAKKNNSTPFLASSNSAGLKAFFVSYNGGSTWGLIHQGSAALDPLSNNANLATGDYAHVIVVNPLNPDMVLFGGYAAFAWTRNRNLGSDASPVGSWDEFGSRFAINTPFYLHENIHDIKAVAGSPNKLYFITDAGIYRSIDMGLTFQPFYKGLVTGQFNSVSIERFPITTAPVSTVSGQAVTPYSGFIGGTGGNGLTYFSGTFSTVTQESSYIGGEVYNAEYSKILPDAAFFSTGNGNLYRTTNVKTAQPSIVNMNAYTGPLSRLTPGVSGFSNDNVNTGTPFRLWEYYGQRPTSPDSALFYNDSLRFQTSFASVADLVSRSTFTFSAARPNAVALIDSIVIRTGTVTIPVSGSENVSVPFTQADKKDITLKLTNGYVPSASVTVLTGTSLSTTGPISTSVNPTVSLNAGTALDEISVTFSAPPYANKTQTSSAVDNSSYYRIFATVFYKYKAGDAVSVVDNNISTRTATYSTVLTKPLNWAYGSYPSFEVAASNSATPNGTYVLTPGNVSQSSPVFTVSPAISTSYTITQQLTFSISAKPVTHTIVADPTTGIPSPTFVLMPGNITQTTGTFFVKSPATVTDFTITETGSNSVTAQTFSTIGTATYVLNPGAISQSDTLFVVTPTASTNYNMQGLSSNTLSGLNTTVTALRAPVRTFSTVGNSAVSFAKNNQPVKIAMLRSARLALAIEDGGITGGANAIVVSKAPLSLNDPLNFVRVSQSGCLSDEPNGSPSQTLTIQYTGKPSVLEWSKNGTELYFAINGPVTGSTTTSNLYRVSHITDIMDLSPASYSGKFYTDVFQYVNSSANSANINPRSPYRTTLVGSFSKHITSISVSNDDNNVLVTLNGAQGGASSSVMYSSGNIKTASGNAVTWSAKAGGDLTANAITYSSLIEKNDSKKVFVGTDDGLYYTSDITAGTWSKVNNLQLPAVQIFDIEQQVMDHWDSYNSGEIYVATNGRGVWSSRALFVPYVVAIEEFQKPASAGNLNVYPNPSNGGVTVQFTGIDGEDAMVNIMDISGRLVLSENLGKLNQGEIEYRFDTKNLNSGVYIVNISSNSGVQRVTKLVVTK